MPSDQVRDTDRKIQQYRSVKPTTPKVFSARMKQIHDIIDSHADPSDPYMQREDWRNDDREMY